MRDADAALISEIERMTAKLSLTRSTAELVKDIKETMRTQLPSRHQTVMHVLFEGERAKVFNTFAAEMFSDVRRNFDNAFAEETLEFDADKDDLVRVRADSKSARRVRRLAANAWKQDIAADRRAREGSTAPHRGRPEIYDRDVVRAFADAIAGAADRAQFTTGHHGDITLGDRKGGALFRVLVAAVRWAMTAAWQSAAPPGTPPPVVKPEGVLTAFKRTQ